MRLVTVNRKKWRRKWLEISRNLEEKKYQEEEETNGDPSVRLSLFKLSITNFTLDGISCGAASLNVRVISAEDLSAIKTEHSAEEETEK